MEYLKINEDCKFVRGHRRSIIYDLGYENYYFIPNALCELANKFDKNKFSEIFDYYGIDNEKIVSEYLDFLIDNQFAIICTKEQCDIFSPLILEWKNSSIITNAIIEISSYLNFNLIFNQLENLGCYHLELRSYSSVNIQYLNKIIYTLKNTAVKSVNIIIAYSSNIKDLKEIIKNNKRISSVILHSAPTNKIIESEIHFSLIKKKLSNSIDYVAVNPDFFNVNIALFTESQKYNTYFNRKVAIDKDGNIKNCLNTLENFGKISNDKIVNIIRKKTYQKFWCITKDSIYVCMDCEFRYMCVNGSPLNRINNKIVCDYACSYNPYIALWKWQANWIRVEQWRKENPNWEEHAKK